MLLNLSGVFAGSESLPFEYEIDLSDLEFSGCSSLKKPVKIKGAAKNRAGVVFIELTAEYTISAPCDRCAADIERKESLPLTYVVVQETEGEDTEDFVVAEDQKVDLDPLVRDDIVIRYPSKLLCSPDCKGLCPNCGKNLNEGNCDCAKEQTDPRLDALKAFFD